MESAELLRGPRDKRNCFTEVCNIEKQLWARIHSIGLLHSDVRDLYRRACCTYEKVFLAENKLEELQDIEYSLWKLHYKHIDEFRKRISQVPANEENKSSGKSSNAGKMQNIIDEHKEGFKSFLSEAINFYQELITKIKRYYGVLEEPFLHKKAVSSSPIELTRLHKCQFLCHRLSICVGDLARYSELYEKPDVWQRNWSFAAKYYFEAAQIYPDSGNPQNQLAVLATYVGDQFLALYHCVRSLAVKEPFPDALDNLILLFERNRSNHTQSIPGDSPFDFLKPSERIRYPTERYSSDGSSKFDPLKATENAQSTEANLWSFFIRMTGVFFLKSSLENFSFVFASTMKELEALLALGDANLNAALESYKSLGLSQVGPHRAIHIVVVLIFIIDDLSKIPETKDSRSENELQRLALTATFICVGRLVDRCLRSNPNYLPLLPAVLVFVEWLEGGALERVEIPGTDEKCRGAKLYFFGSFVELLNQLHTLTRDVGSPDCIPLWEDYETRGFTPISHAHSCLDFSTRSETENKIEMKNECRANRIIRAAINIVKRSASDTRKWIFYDEVGRNFYMTEGKECRERRKSEDEKLSSDTEGKEFLRQVGVTVGEKGHEACGGDKSIAVEEEEEIVFKPITRHNSAPLDYMITREGTENRPSSSNESLRRASSVLIAQNRALINSLTSPSTAIGASGTAPLPQNEPRLNEPMSSAFSEAPMSAGPPSLSAWVLDSRSLFHGREKIGDTGKNLLEHVEVGNGVSDFSLDKDKNFNPGFRQSPYCPPAPSAPLLPPGFQESPYFENLGISSSIGFSPPLLQQMNSSLSSDFYMPMNFNNSLHSHETQRFVLLDGYGYSFASPGVYLERAPLFPSSPFLHGVYDQRREMLFHDFQRAELPPPPPPPVLQHLKEREEWQLQQESQVTGFTFMRN
ncbi:hypothetical protein Nepgr_017674 [Nepenthes gracilis]|uniref:Uncharacterized protein n=1 Tax=Nepenthes gracilis TaxID=150966 RepID=A0AAD3SQU2_NEPGR|nr:hypothetical protein Nepgr_017674 [Nepenthes gracilis]